MRVHSEKKNVPLWGFEPGSTETHGYRPTPSAARRPGSCNSRFQMDNFHFEADVIMIPPLLDYVCELYFYIVNALKI
jgi:hypothetical protein